jgi:protein-L-isoaspartate(D-aspartate) O-methyltransferase
MLRGTAYIDEDLPIGEGRYMLEPMVLGRLVQAADIRRDEVVLDVGCGTGYCAAILSRLAKSVIAIESEPALARRAKASLTAMAIGNVTVFEQKLELGYAQRAPYNAILLGGTVRDIPTGLLDQLAEGGRLVGVTKAGPGAVGQAVILERVGGAISRRVLFDASIHPLPGFMPEPGFTF